MNELNELIQPTEIAEKLIRVFVNLPTYGFRYIKAEECSNGLREMKMLVSERQFSILQILKYTDKNTISEIAQLFNISKSTLSIVMKKLIEKGFVTKSEPSFSDDKRKTYFHISESGNQLLDNLKQKKENSLKLVFSKMTEEQMESYESGVQCFSKIFRPENSAKLNNLDKMSLFEESNFVNSFFVFNLNKVNSFFSGGEITRHQFFILLCILKYKKNTINKLVEFLNVSVSSISITVSKLVAKGFIIKELPPSGEDGRIIYLRLTDKAIKLTEDCIENVKELFSKIIAEMSEEDKELLNCGLDYIIKAFSYKL